MLYHLYFFSATGNTAQSVNLMEAALKAAGHTVDTVSINRWTKPLTPQPDRLVIAYPTLAGRPPALVMRFLATLPSVKKTSQAEIKAAVFTADGGGCLDSPKVVEKKLKRKGYAPFITSAAHYPANWTQLISPPAGAQKTGQIESGKKMTNTFIHSLIEDKPFSNLENKFSHKLFNIVGILFDLFGRRFLGKLYIADDDCNSCGLCKRTCPVGAIVPGKSPGARPFWKINCESCNRCINICPTRAINSSPARGLLLMLLIIILCIFGIKGYTALVIPLYAGAARLLAAILNICGYILAIAAGHLVTLAIIDPFILRPLMRIKFFRRIMQKSFTKKYNRYTCNGYKAPQEMPAGR